MTVPGNYSVFEEKAEEYRLYHQRLYAERSRKEEKAEASIQQLRASARKTGDDKAMKQAAARQRKAAERIGLYREDGKRFKTKSLKIMDAKAVRLPSRATCVVGSASLTLALPDYPCASRTLDGALLTLNSVSIGYTSRPRVLADVTLSLSAGARVALVGENGSGKSTLMQLLAGGSLVVRSDDKGEFVQRGRAVLVDQNHLNALVDAGSLTPLAYLLARHPKVFKDEHCAWSHLGRFGLGGSTLPLQPIGTLSGGLRARVMLADAFAGDAAPDVLLLDEPTNHLDAETVTALADVLGSFPGAIVTVSHNCAFLLALCRDLWIVQQPARGDGPSSVRLQPADSSAGFLENLCAFAETIVRQTDRRHIREMLTIRFMRHSNVVQQSGGQTSLIV
jgi:ATPase subunit of ABC transporter with duplicated ATPase domains